MLNLFIYKLTGDSFLFPSGTNLSVLTLLVRGCDVLYFCSICAKWYTVEVAVHNVALLRSGQGGAAYNFDK